jgi:uroporphyrin-3 C-methyltransferase
MTNNESHQENLSTEVKQKPATPAKKSLTNKNTLFTLIMSCLFIILFSIGFLWIMPQYQHLQENQRTLTEEIQQLSKKYKELQETQQTILDASSQKFKNDESWMLMKANQYLELANIQAHWNGVSEAIIALIEQTDSTLSEITQYSVVEIRKALADALMQLKSLPKIDTEGMLSQLDAIQIQIGVLQKKPLMPSPIPETNDLKPASQTESDWQTRLQNSMDIVKKMVVVRSQDETTTPILSALHLKIIQENIRFNLQQAELALLMQNEKIFVMALTKAIEQIQSTFDTNSQPVKTVIQQLETLKTTQFLKPSLQLENPLQLLKQIMKQGKNP